ncbi:MAG: ABC transporter ATP-binding protein [Acidimicrobiaceae bacterium]|nr:ABC transporter ATP-binding protein [Acidimicrobiaceae bacterium]MDE0515341.1 ABC transporter ATP-binding protein [Acidimicrobiaceae bacterium]
MGQANAQGSGGDGRAAPVDMPQAGVTVAIEGVSRRFRTGFLALTEVDLTIGAGELVAVVGPSGCGKSTLLKIIAGLLTPTDGVVDFGGDRPETGYVFQDAHLLPWRNAIRNVELFLEVDGVRKQERRERARQALQLVGLADFEGSYPAELSGGMKMRVSLARTFATDPQLMLFDEPFAALDEITRNRLNNDLIRLQRDRGVTGVFVTHSIGEAVFLADRVAVMSPAPGRIVGIVDVPFGGDRSAALRTSAEFAAVARDVSEIMAAYEVAEGQEIMAAKE